MAILFFNNLINLQIDLVLLYVILLSVNFNIQSTMRIAVHNRQFKINA